MKFENCIFNQILNFIPYNRFDMLVKQFNADKYVKYFTCEQQLTVLLYFIITGKDSLRDIILGLSSHQSKLYHIGLSKICRSTLSDANNKRDYRIYEGLFYHILEKCRSVTPHHKFKFTNPLYSIDSTTIDLCLSVFPWAKFRKKKGAIKLHCRLDHSGEIPDFIVITDGKKHDSKVAWNFPITSDSIYVIDRGYIEFKWLYNIEELKAFWVTRMKSNLQYEITGQHKPPVGKGIISDQKIRLTGLHTSLYYPKEIRMIKFYDEEKNKFLVFLTNNFELDAETIAQIYKSRWQIELFFKWIKQNLKIKTFLGTSQNAVLTQVWIAMCYFLIVAYIKYQTKYGHSMLELARLFRETLFERASIIDILNLNIKRIDKLKKFDYELTFL